MPAAVWTGTLSFGLVNVPVRLVNATEPKDVRFHLYDRTGRRVRYERVVDGLPAAAEDKALPSRPAGPSSGESVSSAPEETDAIPTGAMQEAAAIAWDDVRRGWENDAGEVVLLSREEIEQVRPQRSRTIEVEDFVDLADIDPVFFEKTYYAIPQSLDDAKPYALLLAAMREAGRVGIGRFVLRTKPHLVAVRPMKDVLAVETLFFGDEVRDPAALVPSLGGVQVDDRELRLAAKLIEMLRTEWDPAAYADTYRDDLLRILSEKASVPAASVPEPSAEGPSAVEELMAALKESVEAARARQKRSRRSKKAG